MKSFRKFYKRDRMSRGTAAATKLFVLLALGLVFAQQSAAARRHGTLTGRVIALGTKEPLFGASVEALGTEFGIACDTAGEFRFKKVPPGVYSVRVSMIGYKQYIQDSLVVSAGEVTSFEVSLESKLIEYEAVTVEARKIENTDAALLTDRRKASSLTDAISAEAISRSGSSNAAAAMAHVIGVTVSDGKYINIRGLGDRYTNATLNGATLPSSDPDRQSAPLDLIGAGMLDNIVVQKTFTADMPGNFTGGSVDLRVKDYPSSETLTFGSSSSFNTQASFSNDFLRYTGGSTDWLGIDDGSRGLPDRVSNTNFSIPSIGSAFVNSDSARALDEISRSFNTEMAPALQSAPVNQSYSVSYGNKYRVSRRPLGLSINANYDRNISLYKDGQVGRWNSPGNVNTVQTLSKDYLLNDNRSTDKVSWGGLANAAYELGRDQTIRANVMYNRGAEVTSRYLFGELPRDLGEDEVFETRALGFTERELKSGQVSGTHKFTLGTELELDWQAGYSQTEQNNPDLRFFSDDYRFIKRLDTTVYSINPSKYPGPTHYFRNLDESVRDVKANIVIPFTKRNASGQVKFGVASLSKNRTFRERQFDYKTLGSSWGYTGDPNSYFANNAGNNSENSFWSGLYITDATDLRNSYDGAQDVTGVYASVSYPLTGALTVVTGARYETTQMETVSLDADEKVGYLRESDLLPSLNLVLRSSRSTNFRAAYGKTLARPTLREMAPFPSFEFINDYILSGNPDLGRTLVDNYDLRWESFPRPGEVLALSAYYKNFTNPIERTIIDANGSIQFTNVPSGKVYGLELEVRKHLDQMGSALSHFFIGGNLTLVHSQVDIGDNELTILRAFDSNASSTRPMQGQSGYIINAELTYENRSSGTILSGMFNVFGERLSAVSLGGTPDVYEQPRPELNMTLSQRLYGAITLKAGGANLLNSKFRETHEYKGQEYIFREYSNGSTFSVGLSYSPM